MRLDGDGKTTGLDPRPELAGDSALWVRLLALADKNYEELSKPLRAMHRGGARLRKLSSGNYGLRPELGRRGWPTEKVYREQADEQLGPHRELLKLLLWDFTERLAEDLVCVDPRRRFQAEMDVRGHSIFHSRKLGERVCVAQDAAVAEAVRNGTAAGMTVYTRDEIRELAEDVPDEADLRQVHAAKKLFGGKLCPKEVKTV